MKEEQKIASASYIINFMGDVDSLTWEFSNYINILVQFQQKYPQTEIDKGVVEELEEQDQMTIRDVIQRLRGELVKSYLRYNALVKEVPDMEYKPEKNGKTLKQLYDSLVNNPILERSTLEEYCVALNNVFVSGVMSELLMKSNQILAALTK